MYNRSGQSGFGLPGFTPMVQRIMIVCGIVWLLELRYANELLGVGAVRVETMLSGWLWQPFTYMWLHAPGIGHIFFNMFALWMFGGVVEQVWGSRRFLRFYLTCGIGAGVLIFLWSLVQGPTHWSDITLGASGAVYGVLTAFSLMWPDRTIYFVFPPIPLKAIYVIPLLFVMQIFLFPSGNISHAGHLGGVLVAGFLMRDQLKGAVNLRALRYRWHRWRMRNRLRAVRREEWEKQRRRSDNDDRPTYH